MRLDKRRSCNLTSPLELIIFLEKFVSLGRIFARARSRYIILAGAARRSVGASEAQLELWGFFCGGAFVYKHRCGGGREKVGIIFGIKTKDC